METMEMTTVQIDVPAAMKPYIATSPELLLVQRALLLHPYIKNLTISHGRAAEILGISKWRLIELYAAEGIPYIDMPWSEVEEDVATCLAVMEKAKAKAGVSV